MEMYAVYYSLADIGGCLEECVTFIQFEEENLSEYADIKDFIYDSYEKAVEELKKISFGMIGGFYEFKGVSKEREEELYAILCASNKERNAV